MIWDLPEMKIQRLRKASVFMLGFQREQSTMENIIVKNKIGCVRKCLQNWRSPKIYEGLFLSVWSFFFLSDLLFLCMWLDASRLRVCKRGNWGSQEHFCISFMIWCRKKSSMILWFALKVKNFCFCMLLCGV